MRQTLRRHLTPPMFVALLALVLSVSGVSYAARTLAAPDRERAAATAVQPTLPSGATMRGYFAAAGGDSTEGYFADAGSFPYKLPGTFFRDQVQYVRAVDDYTNKCPGPGQAKPGWACFYEEQIVHASLCCIYGYGYHDPTVGKYGFRIYWNVNGTESYADGSWAVTAP